jgi:hypothetical protein
MKPNDFSVIWACGDSRRIPNERRKSYIIRQSPHLNTASETTREEK